MKIKIAVIVLIVLAIAVPMVFVFSQMDGENNRQAQQNQEEFTVATAHENDYIVISWNMMEGVESYKIFKNYQGEKSEELVETTGDNFVDSDISFGKEITYKVQACDKKGDVKFSKELHDVMYCVCVETGHGIDENGSWDTGCTLGEDQEAKLMIPVAKATSDYLKKCGVYVWTDAYTDNDRNLNAVLDYLDTHEVNAFVNIHCDYEYAKPGTHPLYNTKEQKKLAEALNEGVHSEVSLADQGPEYRDDLETLCNEKVHCTSCLFETGSIKEDNSILKEQYDAIGKGLAKGICKYLGIEFTADK